MCMYIRHTNIFSKNKKPIEISSLPWYMMPVLIIHEHIGKNFYSKPVKGSGTREAQ